MNKNKFLQELLENESLLIESIESGEFKIEKFKENNYELDKKHINKLIFENTAQYILENYTELLTLDDLKLIEIYKKENLTKNDILTIFSKNKPLPLRFKFNKDDFLYFYDRFRKNEKYNGILFNSLLEIIKNDNDFFFSLPINLAKNQEIYKLLDINNIDIYKRYKDFVINNIDYDINYFSKSNFLKTESKDFIFSLIKKTYFTYNEFRAKVKDFDSLISKLEYVQIKNHELMNLSIFTEQETIEDKNKISDLIIKSIKNEYQTITVNNVNSKNFFVIYDKEFIKKIIKEKKVLSLIDHDYEKESYERVKHIINIVFDLYLNKEIGDESLSIITKAIKDLNYIAPKDFKNSELIDKKNQIFNLIKTKNDNMENIINNLEFIGIINEKDNLTVNFNNINSVNRFYLLVKNTKKNSIILVSESYKKLTKNSKNIYIANKILKENNLEYLIDVNTTETENEIYFDEENYFYIDEKNIEEKVNSRIFIEMMIINDGFYNLLLKKDIKLSIDKLKELIRFNEKNKNNNIDNFLKQYIKKNKSVLTEKEIYNEIIKSKDQSIIEIDYDKNVKDINKTLELYKKREITKSDNEIDVISFKIDKLSKNISQKNTITYEKNLFKSKNYEKLFNLLNTGIGNEETAETEISKMEFNELKEAVNNDFFIEILKKLLKYNNVTNVSFKEFSKKENKIIAKAIFKKINKERINLRIDFLNFFKMEQRDFIKDFVIENAPNNIVYGYDFDLSKSNKFLTKKLTIEEIIKIFKNKKPGFFNEHGVNAEYYNFLKKELANNNFQENLEKIRVESKALYSLMANSLIWQELTDNDIKNKKYKIREQSANNFLINNFSIDDILLGLKEIVEIMKTENVNLKLCSRAISRFIHQTYYEDYSHIGNPKFDSVTSEENTLKIFSFLFKEAPYHLLERNKIGNVNNIENFISKNIEYFSSLENLKCFIFPNHYVYCEHYSFFNSIGKIENILNLIIDNAINTNKIEIIRYLKEEIDTFDIVKNSNSSIIAKAYKEKDVNIIKLLSTERFKNKIDIVFDKIEIESELRQKSKNSKEIKKIKL